MGISFEFDDLEISEVKQACLTQINLNNELIADAQVSGCSDKEARAYYAELSNEVLQLVKTKLKEKKEGC